MEELSETTIRPGKIFTATDVGLAAAAGANEQGVGLDAPLECVIGDDGGGFLRGVLFPNPLVQIDANCPGNIILFQVWLVLFCLGVDVLPLDGLDPVVVPGEGLGRGWTRVLVLHRAFLIFEILFGEPSQIISVFWAVIDLQDFRVHRVGVVVRHKALHPLFHAGVAGAQADVHRDVRVWEAYQRILFVNDAPVGDLLFLQKMPKGSLHKAREKGNGQLVAAGDGSEVECYSGVPPYS